MILTPDLLLRAYAAGVFPMAEGRCDPVIHWIDPQRRAVFPMSGLHTSHSLARHIRRTQPRVSVDTDFAGVVRGCANRPETWINAEIFAAYATLFDQGHAHSLEVWQGPELIGGIYGVVLGAAFFGESMFSAEVNGSKMALAYLMHRLQAGGFKLFDVQFMTDHLASLGAVEISRTTYRKRLGEALAAPAQFAPQGYPPEPEAGFVLSSVSGTSHLSTQTS
jgi:leucyl/phenylalanyl-tRNA---protein transferase